MAILTPNHSLKKPNADGLEGADLRVFVGENMDKIDTALATKITKDGSGKVASADLPTATASIKGGIKVGTGLSVTADGTLSSTGGGSIVPATATVLGGIKVGSGLAVTGDGTLSATGGGGGSTVVEKIKAYQTTAQAFTSGAWTKINFQSLSVDDGGGFSTTTSEYTVPTTGTYHIGGTISFNGAVDAQRFVLAYYINGVSTGWVADLGHSRGTGTNGQIIVEGNTLAYLTAGQKLTFYCYTTAASSTQIVSGNQITTMYAYRMI